MSGRFQERYFQKGGAQASDSLVPTYPVDGPLQTIRERGLPGHRRLDICAAFISILAFASPTMHSYFITNKLPRSQ